MTFDSTSFATHGYKRINSRRQEHLVSLRLDLSGKSVLEVGAGVGDHTMFFLDRGCSVTSVEARKENCEVFVKTMRAWHQSGYEAATKWKLHQADVNRLDELPLEHFDIVYAYGILYHVADPAHVLKLLADRCSGTLLLETCVSLGNYFDINLTPEQAGTATQSIQGMGCRPTRPWLFRELSKLFEHVYVPLTQPAHELFPTDWTVPPTQNTTRAVFIASRQPIQNALLSNQLLDQQTY